ncbi:1,3-beta-glucanase, partial [Streptomyces sp. NPDC127574]
MDSPRLLRRCLFAALSAALVASASAVAAPAHAGPAAAAAAVTFQDTFDGAAGSAVDSSKWQIETGDNVSNHERQYYTTG